MLDRLSLSQLNQARSMLLAAQSVGREEVNSQNKKALPQVMKMMLPSMCLRAVVVVVVVSLLSTVSDRAGVPSVVTAIAAYSLILALGGVVIGMWCALVYWRASGASITERLSSPGVERRLLYISLAGYSAAALLALVGAVVFPSAFP